MCFPEFCLILFLNVQLLADSLAAALNSIHFLQRLTADLLQDTANRRPRWRIKDCISSYVDIWKHERRIFDRLREGEHASHVRRAAAVVRGSDVGREDRMSGHSASQFRLRVRKHINLKWPT